ncbi:MAG TPA: sensor histidine kinase [bacterium (Candidatus Stahlbacteria)]|nr:sensor histidine kinase [Candidatus Stahlbacteria bacterium]
MRKNELYLSISQNPKIFNFFDAEERNFLKTINAELCFPLIARNQLVGILILSRRDGFDFTQDEIELLDNIIPEAALAIENARLHEKEKLRLKQYYEQDKLASLGKLSTAVAHEIKNPLASIKGLARIMEKDLKDNNVNKKHLGVIISEVDRLNNIVNQLTNFAKPILTKFQFINVEPIIGEVVDLLRMKSSRSNIKIIHESEPNLPPIYADGANLKQAFLNVGLNALESMPNGGNLMIKVATDKDSILVHFIDNGVGIQKQVINKIFDPFFTTKEKGTGLGLPIVKKIIDKHEGKIKVESTPGKGTDVMISLPIKQEGRRGQRGLNKAS